MTRMFEKNNAKDSDKESLTMVNDFNMEQENGPFENKILDSLNIEEDKMEVVHKTLEKGVHAQQSFEQL